MGRDCTYLRSQCRLKVCSQELQDSLGASHIALSILRSSKRTNCSGVGETGSRRSSRLLPEVAGVSKNDCSSSKDDLSLSVGVKTSSSPSEASSVVRYGACITGLTSSSKKNGLKEGESPNLDDDEV